MASPLAHTIIALGEVYGWEKRGARLWRDNESIKIESIAMLVRIIGWERAGLLLRLRGQVTFGRLNGDHSVELPAA